MTILITGAYGFVGSNLSRFLAERGAVCWAVDVAQPASAVGAYERFFSWNELDAGLPWDEVDAVVHLAGKAHDTRANASAENDQVYLDVNLGLTQRLFRALEEKRSLSGVPFIFFSSVKACADCVVPGKPGIETSPKGWGILTEEAEMAPATPYGKSKAAAELFLQEAIARGTKHRVFIFRPAMIHGPGNKGNLNLLYQVVRRGVPWPLGAFENCRSFASIENVCEVVWQFCGKVVEPGIYQIADDEGISVNRLIELIAQGEGKKARIWRCPKGVIRLVARMGDVMCLPLNTERLIKLTESYVVSNRKVLCALGMNRMPVPAETGLQKTIDSLKNERLKNV